MPTVQLPEAPLNLEIAGRDELVEGTQTAQLVTQDKPPLDGAAVGQPQLGQRCDSAHRELLAQSERLTGRPGPSHRAG